MRNIQLKKQLAQAAIEKIPKDEVIGVGSGSTIRYFIEALAPLKHQITGAVASSEETERLLKKHGIPIIELNHVDRLPLYVDSADQFNRHRYLTKGGGGALTREKIIAQASDHFLCIVDHTKATDVLGGYPIAIEVLPMARSYIARAITRLKGTPVYRSGFITDNKNIILDVHQWHILNPPELETTLNQLPGIVATGLFTLRPPDQILIASPTGIEVL